MPIIKIHCITHRENPSANQKSAAQQGNKDQDSKLNREIEPNSPQSPTHEELPTIPQQICDQ